MKCFVWCCLFKYCLFVVNVVVCNTHTHVCSPHRCAAGVSYQTHGGSSVTLETPPHTQPGFSNSTYAETILGTWSENANFCFILAHWRIALTHFSSFISSFIFSCCSGICQTQRFFILLFLSLLKGKKKMLVALNNCLGVKSWFP